MKKEKTDVITKQNTKQVEQKIEKQKEDAMNDDLFLAFFNELRVAANKEYLKLSLF